MWDALVALFVLFAVATVAVFVLFGKAIAFYWVFIELVSLVIVGVAVIAYLLVEFWNWMTRNKRRKIK